MTTLPFNEMVIKNFCAKDSTSFFQEMRKSKFYASKNRGGPSARHIFSQFLNVCLAG